MRQCVAVILVLWFAVVIASFESPPSEDDVSTSVIDLVTTTPGTDIDDEDVTNDPGAGVGVGVKPDPGARTEYKSDQGRTISYATSQPINGGVDPTASGAPERLTLARCNLRQLDDTCIPVHRAPPRALDLSRNLLRDVAASSAAATRALAALRALDVSSNIIAAVSIRWTRGTPLLRALDLSANNVSHVEVGSMTPLVHLRWLNASANRLATPPLTELPASLRVLDLSANGISALPDGAARHLRVLRALHLRDNRLPELRASWFEGLVALQLLDLSGNDVRVLDMGVFAALGALTELRLRANRIESLALGCFQGLKNLKTLDLSENVITMLEKDSLAPLGELRVLSLRENRLDNIFDGCFSALVSVEDLDLSGNRLTTLENASFSALASLQRLNLSGNRIESMGEGCWTGMGSLIQLDLSRNALSQLENGSFSALGASLLSLDVSRNRVSALGEDVFAGLVRLQRLDASENALRAVWPGALAPLAGLTELRVAGNPLLPTQRLLPASRRLQRVDASRTRLRQVPAALTRSVRALALAGNAVVAVRRGDLDSYPLLRTLALSDNRVAEVEEDALGRLENLAELRLDGNRLSAVPRSLPASLRMLHLQRNRIVVLHSTDLQDLPRLRELSLRECVLTSIEAGAFADLVALEELDLSSNPLLSLPPDALAGPGRLQVLRMSYLTHLTPPPSDTDSGVGLFPVGAPERLEVLALDGSPLLAQQLLGDAAALAAFRQLRELDLRAAKLNRLRADLFGYLPRLASLRLADNPWSCVRADEILWLAQWMRRQDEEVQKDLKSGLCDEPPAFKGRPIIELRSAEFRGEGGTASPEAEKGEDTSPICPALVALCQELLSENVTLSASTAATTPTTPPLLLHTLPLNRTPIITKLQPIPSSFTTFAPPLVHIIPSEPKPPKSLSKDENDTLKKKTIVNSTKVEAFLSTKRKNKLLNITVLHSVTIPPFPQETTAPLSSTPRTRSSSFRSTSAVHTTASPRPSNTRSRAPIATAAAKVSTPRIIFSASFFSRQPPLSTTRHIVAPTASSKSSSLSPSRPTHSSTLSPFSTRAPPRSYPSTTRSETPSPPPPKNISRTKPFDTIMRDKAPTDSEALLTNITRTDAPKRDAAKELPVVMLQDQPQPEAAPGPSQTVGSFIDETRRKLKQDHDLRRLSPFQHEEHPPIIGVTKSLSTLATTKTSSTAIKAQETTVRVSSGTTTSSSGATTAEAWRSGESLLLENTTSLAQPRAAAAAAADSASDAASDRGSSTHPGAGAATPFARGSHPGMFVLLAMGVAVAAALATALSHCAKRHRRRRAAVEYSRQQDIEVRSMSSVGGDLW